MPPLLSNEVAAVPPFVKMLVVVIGGGLEEGEECFMKMERI
jgi:hypothetical protein